MRRRPIGRTLALAATSACALLMLAGPASAATINVNTTNDENNHDADCALREATIAANTNAPVSGCTAGSGPDTINVPAGPYTLSIPGADEDQSQTGDLDITEQATIAGAGARRVTVDADGIDRAIHLRSNEQGGGVCRRVPRAPSACAQRVGPAGPVVQNGPTTISGLTATGGETDGQGGGLKAEDDLNLREVTVDANKAADGGGGAQLDPGIRIIRIVRSTFSDNVDTSQDGGGAINNNSQRLTIDSSTFSGNRATRGLGGAILEHGARLELTSSTFVKNVAQDGGGGIADAEDDLVGTNGIDGESDVDTARNTIIANNRFTGVSPSGGSSTGGDNCNQPLASQGFNLENKDECGFSAASDKPNTPPGIGPLANNGGQTDTHRLTPNSAAVDDGNADAGIDQRRMGRPKDGDGNGSRVDDIGAFELGEGPPVARNDSYSTQENQRLDVPPPGVLGNDSDPQGDPLEAELARQSQPPEGDVTLRPDGSFSYRPRPNFTGRDEIFYRACDNQSPRQCDFATLTITVRGDGSGTGGEEQPPCTITGTPGNDILRGTPGRDVICGRGGNDVIYGLAGDDILRGGGGNDVLRGGDGDDQLSGNEGSDDLVGGDGDDSLEGGAGADDLTGQGGNDSLDGSDGVRGNDVANGGPGSDSCSSDPDDERTSC